MARGTTKKTAAKKTAAKKTTSSNVVPADSSPEVKEAARRADTPNVEATDFDRDESCRYCGRDAVTDGMCEKHAARRGVEA
jgi:hypothetical protein